MSHAALPIAIAEARQRADVRLGVWRIYDQLQREIDSRQPVCRASGRCCRFEEYGHRLYVTTAELAAFADGLQPAKPPQDGPSGQKLPILEQTSAGCVFQVDGRCSVHAIRPFGCRIFFCDPTAGDWQQTQYERFHALIKQLHENLAVPYYYVEWRAGLSALSAAMAIEIGQFAENTGDQA